MNRVSTAQLYDFATSAMLRKNAETQQTQRQLSSGLRVEKPSDDPAAAARSLAYSEDVAGLSQDQRNITAAQSRLDLAEDALGQATELLYRANEIAIGSANEPRSNDELKASGQEIRQIEQELMRLANTRDSSGEYIFAGYKSQKPAYSMNDATGKITYSGNRKTREVQISPTTSIEMTIPGPQAFGNDGKSIFASLERLADTLEKGDSLGQSKSEVSRKVRKEMGNIQVGVDRIATARADVGARVRALNDTRQTNSLFSVGAQTHRSRAQDLNYAQGASTLALESNALQATQSSFAKVQGLSLFNYLGR